MDIDPPRPDICCDEHTTGGEYVEEEHIFSECETLLMQKVKHILAMEKYFASSQEKSS